MDIRFPASRLLLILVAPCLCAVDTPSHRSCASAESAAMYQFGPLSDASAIHASALLKAHLIRD